jgi:hypothetical protein
MERLNMTKVKGKEILTYSHLSLILKEEGKEMILAQDTIANFIDNNTIGVKLYSTIIIKMYVDDTYELSMLFPSSKILDTFLRFTPAVIVLKDLLFYVARDVSKGARKENLVPFFNGLTVDKHGNLYSVQA